MKKYLLILFVSSLIGSTYSQTTVTFNYTGAVQTWTVPACVTSISVDVRGADGGGANGGNGARVTHPNIAVTPGQVLEIRVGGSGGIPAAGWNGGGAGANAGGSCGVVPSCGGGGASDIRVAPYAMGNRIIVAGGGGGRNGGSTNVSGGGGGCNNGLMGTSSYGVGGAGGTQVTGGNGGGPWGGGASGQAGSLGQGGNGAADPCYNYGPGGGGGGGYYGGGGGGSDCFPGCPLGGGGGGGGSSFTPAGGACTQSFNNGAGIVSITYTGGSPPLVVSNTGPYCEMATVQLNSTAGGLTYTWTGPNGFTSSIQNPTLPLADTLMSGMYILTMTMVGGCSSTDTTTVFVNPNPNAVATNTGPYCVGDVVQLTSVAGLPTDDWTGPGGYSVIDVQNPTLTPAAVAMSGTYTVTIANGFGCSNTASTTVVVNPLPAAVAGNTGPYCEGDVVDITSNGGTDYDWTGPGGFVLNNTQNTTIPGAVMGMNGTYTVTVTDANNCVSTATTAMVVNLLPIPTANNTGPYCAGETVSLTSSGGTGYAWTGPAVFASASQNPNIPSSIPTNSGTYDVLVTSAFGCTATASTNVVVTALPIPTASNTGDYCEGERVDLSSTGGLTYAWVGPLLFNSSNPNPSINGSVPDNSGTYTVTVTDVAGCTSSTTTIVVVHPTPTAVPLYGPDKPSTLNPDVTFMDGSYANINSWLWEFDGTSYNTANFTHTFLTSGTYNGVLTVTNTWGCVDTSVFQVIVIPEIAIYIPNSFTPNDDGLNEVFYIYGTNWSRMETVIFDRWGMQVFSSTDPEKGWNGRMNNNGELLQEGTYAYKVYIIDNYGKEHDIMGHINLLR